MTERTRQGQVLEVQEDKAMVQLLKAQRNQLESQSPLYGDVPRTPSVQTWWTIFSGMGKPIDGGPEIIPEKYFGH